VPDEDIELILPEGDFVDEVENELGKIFKEDEKVYISFKKILAKSGKELESVHSGNLNPIKLPAKLPAFSILRKPVDEESINPKFA